MLKQKSQYFHYRNKQMIQLIVLVIWIFTQDLATGFLMQNDANTGLITSAHWLEWGSWTCDDTTLKGLCYITRTRNCSTGISAVCQITSGVTDNEVIRCPQDTCTGQNQTNECVCGEWGNVNCEYHINQCFVQKLRNCSSSCLTTDTYYIEVIDKDRVCPCAPDVSAAQCIDVAEICPQVASNVELYCQVPNMTSMCPKTCGGCDALSTLPTPTWSNIPISSALWTEWGNWRCLIEGINRTCVMSRERGCTTNDTNDCIASYGDTSKNISSCKSEICPAHWKAWGSWQCPESDAKVCFMVRYRECSTGSTYNCGYDNKHSDLQPCDYIACPAHWTEWGDWECRLTNSGCFKQRYRECSTGKISHCGDENDRWKIETCNCSDVLSTVPTPTLSETTFSSTWTINAWWTEWGHWNCDIEGANRTCVMYRERGCSTNNTNDCIVFSVETSKNILPCKSEICPDLTTLHEPGCLQYGVGGADCNDTAEECNSFKPFCNTDAHMKQICPKTCGCCGIETAGFAQWESWSPWKCHMGLNSTCTMTRNRNCSSLEKNKCNGSHSESLPCTHRECPTLFAMRVDCGLYDHRMPCEDSGHCVVLTALPELVCIESSHLCPVFCGCCVVPSTDNTTPGFAQWGTSQVGTWSSTTPGFSQWGTWSSTTPGFSQVGTWSSTTPGFAQWGTWSSWKCQLHSNSTCFMSRSRNCSSSVQSACNGDHSETQPCTQHDCPAKTKCGSFDPLRLPCRDSDNCDVMTTISKLVCTDTPEMCPVYCKCCVPYTPTTTQLTSPITYSPSLQTTLLTLTPTRTFTSEQFSTTKPPVTQATMTPSTIQLTSSLEMSMPSTATSGQWEEWGNWRCKTVDEGKCVMFRRRNCSSEIIQGCGTYNDSMVVAECNQHICKDRFNLMQCAQYSGDGLSECTDTASACIGLKPSSQACQNIDIASVLCPKACGCCENEIEGYILWGSWSQWMCNKLDTGLNTTCHMSRHRLCTTGIAADCEGPTEEIKDCQEFDCTAHWMTWAEWQCTQLQSFCFMARFRDCSTGIVSNCGDESERREQRYFKCDDCTGIETNGYQTTIGTDVSDSTTVSPVPSHWNGNNSQISTVIPSIASSSTRQGTGASDSSTASSITPTGYTDTRTESPVGLQTTASSSTGQGTGITDSTDISINTSTGNGYSSTQIPVGLQTTASQVTGQEAGVSDSSTASSVGSTGNVDYSYQSPFVLQTTLISPTGHGAGVSNISTASSVNSSWNFETSNQSPVVLQTTASPSTGQGAGVSNSSTAASITPIGNIDTSNQSPVVLQTTTRPSTWHGAGVSYSSTASSITLTGNVDTSNQSLVVLQTTASPSTGHGAGVSNISTASLVKSTWNFETSTQSPVVLQTTSSPSTGHGAGVSNFSTASSVASTGNVDNSYQSPVVLQTTVISSTGHGAGVSNISTASSVNSTWNFETSTQSPVVLQTTPSPSTGQGAGVFNSSTSSSVTSTRYVVETSTQPPVVLQTTVISSTGQGAVVSESSTALPVTSTENVDTSTYSPVVLQTTASSSTGQGTGVSNSSTASSVNSTGNVGTSTQSPVVLQTTASSSTGKGTDFSNSPTASSVTSTGNVGTSSQSPVVLQATASSSTGKGTDVSNSSTASSVTSTRYVVDTSTQSPVVLQTTVISSTGQGAVVSESSTAAPYTSTGNVYTSLLSSTGLPGAVSSSAGQGTGVFELTTLLPHTITPGTTIDPNILGVCNFDRDTICIWTQSNQDSFDWTLQSGPTLTDGTGPNDDHTLQNSQGKYLFIETSAPRLAGEEASIVSPELPSGHTLCLEFWYYMFGTGIGSLQVHAQDTYANKEFELFKKDGDHGEQWFKASVTIFSNQIPHNYRLVITGNVGSSYLGDTAMDDLAILDGACAGTVTTTTDMRTPDTTSTAAVFTTTPLTSTTTTIQTQTTQTTTPAGHWSQWFIGECSVTCGNGSQPRVRFCSTGRNGDCVGSSSDLIPCNEQNCSPTGQWSVWFHGECSKTCGEGTQQRVRQCSTGRDSDCPGSAVETSSCKLVDCIIVASWSDWFYGECSKTCGVGHQQKFRHCSTGNSIDCLGSPLETMPCKVQDCPGLQ